MLNKIIASLKKNRKIILKVCYALMILSFALFITSILYEPLKGYWSTLGRYSARIVSLLFITTLIPGIIIRFRPSDKILNLISPILLYRRQFGMWAYIFVFYHFMWSNFLFKLTSGNLIGSINPIEATGMAAFILLTPLFITSNDYSVRKLGKRWKQIHRLIYIIVWFVFLHIAVQNWEYKELSAKFIGVLMFITALQSFPKVK